MGAQRATETFPVKMMVYTDDRPGMLNQLTTVLFDEQTNIRSLEARADDERGRRRRGDRHDHRDCATRNSWSAWSPPSAAFPACATSRGRNSMIDDVAEPEHIAISKSKGIKIDWKDGHHSEYSLGLSARRVPLRHLHRRARHGAAEIAITPRPAEPVSNVSSRR